MSRDFGLLASLLRKTDPSFLPPSPTVSGEVCRQYQVTRAELTSSRRTARVVLPRHVAMYLCRRHTDAPLGVIGKELGGRDHSTVHEACAKLERTRGAARERLLKLERALATSRD